MSDRVRFIPSPRGTGRVLLIDLTAFASPHEALEYIAEAGSRVATQPKNSVRCLVDVTGARFNGDVVQALKELAAHNRAYVMASAIVGVTGLQRVILDSVIKFSSRKNLKSIPTRDEAFAWLAAQDDGAGATAQPASQVNPGTSSDAR
ncbi:MAG: hypothetical protein M3R65_12760 [Gemmatimonadota bacterium]|nr:hypothetical protein [Gemmatimonadota bacterium]